MGLRPAKCYRNMERPNTRQSLRKPKKGYVKGVPELKMHRFDGGSKTKTFAMHFSLVADWDVQIRDNALEAARIAAQKVLINETGEEGYFLKVPLYPFHVLRENPLATGAGADRYQSGMRQSFGKPIGSAAQVKKRQAILRVSVDAGREAIARRALKTASYKLPVTCHIVQS
ncbi:MAG: 50S ribosomal protein L16 [Candidatus Aenigmarchaeota archaeon]|nr:50S ribosomal protein L16 [Candidatus Aenigmarchaeota archaeon]